MKKLIKILGTLLGSFVVLVIIAMVAVLVFFDPNAYKDEISQQVKEETGRTLEIKGDLSFSVFPWVGISIGETKLSNAKGFEAAPFAQVKEVKVRVKLMPLLSKKLEMDTVTLDGVQLYLGKDKNGRGNWEDMIKKEKKKEAVAEKKADAGAAAIKALEINGIRLQNTRVVWDDRQAGTKYVLDNLALKTGAITTGKPVKLDLNFDLSDEKAKKKWQFGFDGLLALDMKAQTLQLSKMKMNLGGLKLAGQLDGKTVLTSPVFTGKLVSDGFVPKDVMNNFGIAPPKTADNTVLGKARLEMSIHATTTSAALSDLVIKLDDTTLKGKASVSNFQKPAIRFALNVDDIDVDRYLPPVTKDKKSSGKAAKASAGQAPQLPMKTLRGLDVKGSFKVGKMKAYNLHSQKIEMHLLANRGVIRVHPAKAQMYGGHYSGDVQLDVRGSQPVVSMDEKITGVQAGPLFKDAADMGWISGTANLSAKLKGRGLVYEEMRKTLNGHIRFEFKDGSINGVNIPLMIRKAYATLKGLPAPAEEAKKTDFSSITGTATVRNGVVNNPDLLLSSPLIRVKGSGTADLPKEQLDYLVKTEIVASLEGQGGKTMEQLKGLLIPVRIRGPFSKPGFKVEMEEVLKGAVKKKAEEKVKKKIEDKFKDKFKGLFNR